VKESGTGEEEFGQSVVRSGTIDMDRGDFDRDEKLDRVETGKSV